MSSYIILGPHKYFSHIIQILFMIMVSHQFYLHKTHINISHIYYPNHVIGPSQMLLTQAHKLPWALSQILPIIAHILSNLGFHKNTHHITTKIGRQNYIILTQSPASFGLWAKPKESPKFQKFHYDVANSKSLTTMWLIPKPATMRHYLQSPLLHSNTLQNLKIISTKPKFLFGIYFHKAQIIIWHYSTKPKY